MPVAFDRVLKNLREFALGVGEDALHFLVRQNGRAGADSLRAPHRDALVPKGVALPELDTLRGILRILLPEVVLLNEYNLRGGWEQGEPNLDFFWLGRASSQPSDIEGG
ncbi:unnamed protein product [Sphagnum jensenii]|uniref:Uncharacterized protein n=1 Tax=Sphagnum jensenii TaxID=128206 RepID=A0ABP1A761_9BRYO